MFSRLRPVFSALPWLVLAAMIGGCAEYGFKASVNPASEKILQKSIQKEFDLLVRDFDSLDGKGDMELCAPVRFAVTRFAVYQALEERKNAGMAQMTRFIMRARRALTSAQARFQSKTCVDSDGDGLTDLAEVRRHKTNPNSADTDSDGLPDGTEVRRHKTNPLLFDTDGDLLSDGEEVLYLKLSPKNPDSDRDGYSDGYEVTRGTNPRDHCSRPRRGPRFPGPWKKCRRNITGKKRRHRGVVGRIPGRVPLPLFNGGNSNGLLNT